MTKHPPPEKTAMASDDLQKQTDYLLFTASLKDFHREKVSPHRDKRLDWTSDGCTIIRNMPIPGKLFINYFKPSRDRHDSGYRNYAAQNRCEDRARVDRQFRLDMNDTCKTNGPHGCKVWALVAFLAVRAAGRRHCKNVKDGRD